MEDRFEVISRQRSKILFSTLSVLKDKETNVLYLHTDVHGTGGVSVTPLTDADGKPLLHKPE